MPQPIGLRGRSSRGRWLAAIVVGVIVSVAVVSDAQEAPQLDLQRFDPVPEIDGLQRVWQGETPGHLKGGAAVFVNYGMHPFELAEMDSGTRVLGVIDHLAGFDLMAVLGLGDRFAVGIDIPLLQLQERPDQAAWLDPVLGLNDGRVGFGDITVAGTIQILRQRTDQITVAVHPRFVLPTGSRRQLLGSGALGFGVDGAIGIRTRYVQLAANLGIQVQASSAPVLDILADDELRWALGAMWTAPKKARDFSIGLEWTGATVIAPALAETLSIKPFHRTHTPSEILLTFRYDPVMPIAATIGFGPGVGKGFGTPDFRFFLSVVWQGAPRDDADNDGITARIDACPDKPEPVDLKRDHDGCPDEVRAVRRRLRGDILITEPIHFATGSHQILKESVEVVQAVCQVLKDQTDIVHLEIQGHTDQKGSEDSNLSLSQRRADEVRRRLISCGIDAGRLTAKGYGESEPVDSSGTAEADARNRRVQFIVKKKP